MPTTPANDKTTIAPNATGPDRIDVQSDAALAEWAKRFDVSPDQVKEAVAKVGDAAGDVEMHLKGSRSSTNEDQVEKAGD
ncbi:MAG: DUF3606 domain-containing protein [Comamonadaceae bacterium]|nr:MAG: DUF3606 domain-containing protein [Comamonadaceae bacterium]